MPHRRWFPFALAALLVLATLLAWSWLRTPSPDVPTEPLPTANGTAASVRSEPAPAPVQAEAPPERSPDRIAAEPLPLDESRARDRYPQGLRGLAVDEAGAPLADVDVYLLESPANDPLALPALLQQGLTLGPTTSTRTGSDGVFALGVQVATERLYEVHLLAPRRADARASGLRILANQWHDLGPLVLPRGALVRGRVTVEGSDLPAPQASVTLLAGTAFDDTLLRALPGRENGLVALCDAGGWFEFPNAPVRGAIQLQAVAPGFAAELRTNVQPDPQRPVEVQFGLRPGHSLGGTVWAAGGRPVAGARLEAWPMQSAGQALIAHSRADGSFVVHGLTAGPHRLRVTARGFQNVDLPDLLPSRHDLRFELRPRATVRATVRAPGGAVLRSYQVAVRRWFPPKDGGNGQASEELDPARGDLGLCPDVPDQRVRLDGLTDAAEIPGVPPGTYVLQVAAPGFAKCLSAPFVVQPDSGLQDVEVTVHGGVRLLGRVFGGNGAPLADATLTTQIAGALPDNAFWRAFAGASPDKATRSTVTTRADGSFEFTNLSLARYDLVVDHPEHCRTVVRNLELWQPGEQAVPPVRLAVGTLVRGTVAVDGKIPGQVKVILTSAAGPAVGPASDPVRLEAVTDARGRFVMPRRVPAGDYEVRGLVLTPGEADSQAIHQLLQMQRSAQTLVIAPGQGEAICDLALPGR